MKRISILGSTGSIGTQALEVTAANPESYEVFALSANASTDILAKQILKFKPKYAVLGNKFFAEKLCGMIDSRTKILYGGEGLCKVAEEDGYDILLNALMGNIGLKPTVCAVNSGKTVAIANKETLVSGGEIVMELAKKNNVSIIPIDGEHSAIFQCLNGERENKPEKIILTASGGPFRNKSAEELKYVTVSEALNHPNWNMGKKITVDSATMMNKGLEIIEAKWLFNVPASKIEAVIHPESIIHSAVEFQDGSVIAHLAEPDMKLFIQYALTFPKRVCSNIKKLSFFGKTLTFEKPDLNKFPCLELAMKAASAGGLLPCIMNAADEVATEAFLNNKISFLSIYSIIEKTMSAYTQNSENVTLEKIFEADEWARAKAQEQI